jgi:hypothetical protein
MAIHGLQQPKDNGFDVEASDSNSAYSILRFTAVFLLIQYKDWVYKFTFTLHTYEG